RPRRTVPKLEKWRFDSAFASPQQRSVVQPRHFSCHTNGAPPSTLSELRDVRRSIRAPAPASIPFLRLPTRGLSLPCPPEPRRIYAQFRPRALRLQAYRALHAPFLRRRQATAATARL